MQLKKINETKIYDNLEQPEKARLLFKAMKDQNGNTFDKLLNSGESQSWTVRNHEARIFFDSMVHVSLAWGVAYWKNQARMSGSLAVTQSQNEERATKAQGSFKECLILNEAYLIVLDRLEKDYGLLKDIVLVLASVDKNTELSKEFGEIMQDDMLETAVNTLYEQYEPLLQEAMV